MAERTREVERVRIEGVRPILEAICTGRRAVLQITIAEGKGSPGLRELESVARARGLPIRRGRLPGLRAAAEAEPFPEESFEALLGSDSPRFLVALDRITDVGNLGSIARTAACAGATGLVLEHRHAPPLEPGALRASAGALERLRVGRTPHLGRALDLARTEGLRVLAAHPGGEPMERLHPDLFSTDLVWVFGSEDRGLRRSVLERAEHRVGIPLAPHLDSLGVAAAAAYLLMRTAEARRADAGRQGGDALR
jgi:23S rRNA (guanosine2251-2'-O)-methyltransferase